MKDDTVVSDGTPWHIGSIPAENRASEGAKGCRQPLLDNDPPTVDKLLKRVKAH